MTFERVGVDGVELAVRDRGAGAPILMIHGTGGALELYEPLQDRLADTHRTIAYDRRGFGLSSHPPVTDIGVHVEDAAALLERRCTTPAVVVGHSVGGVVALHLALAHPERVSSLVLLEPAVLAHVESGIAEAAGVWQRAREEGGDELGALAFFHWACGSTAGGNAFDDYPEAWQTKMLKNAPAIWAEGHPGGGAGGDRLSAADLRALRLPITLIEGGVTDPCFPPCGAWLAKTLDPFRRVLVPHATHMIQTDAPGVVAAEVRRAHVIAERRRAEPGARPEA